MRESKIKLWERKVNNGKRKQAEKIQHEKEKVWDKLSTTAPTKRMLRDDWIIEEPPDFKNIVVSYSEELEREIVRAFTGFNLAKTKCQNQK